MSKSKRILGVLVFIAGYLAVKVAFAGLKTMMKTENQPMPAIATQQIVPVQQTRLSSLFFDGTGELKLPIGWKVLSQGDLPKGVLFKATNPAQKTDLVVVRVPELTQLTADELAIISDGIAERITETSSMKDAIINPLKPTKINGYLAAQYEIQGVPDKPYQLNHQPLRGAVTVLLTTISTSNRVYNVVTTTPSQDYQKYQADIKQTIQGFQEYKTAAF